MIKLDEKNCMILELLQKDCRMSLTAISKKIGLSIDAVKKRIKKLIDAETFYPRIQIRPRHLGFNNIVDIRIKLHNYTKDQLSQMIDYLVKSPYVVEVFSLSGEFDFAIVVIAYNVNHLDKITSDIRNRFNKIINTWSESLTTKVFKFESYNLLKLINNENIL